MEIQLKRDYFYLSVGMPTATGYTPVGKIFIGYERATARELFRSLKGAPGDVPGVRLELMYSPLDGPEEVLDARCCPLADACENMRLVFKQTFKSINLE